jgi:DNA-binding response OmpR family regulator
MAMERRNPKSLLVLEDVEETATLVGMMLSEDGYCVTMARSEDDAIAQACTVAPDLILVTIGGNPERTLVFAKRIREGSDTSGDIPIVFFCVTTVPEGAEIEVGKKIYLTRPDNFNQLREFLRRLLWNGCA